MRRSLLAFDTDRIKDYVFATDQLKEIRGASNILDTLNRHDMPREVGGTCYYAHGGSGLFVVPTDDVPACIARVRRIYAEKTGGAATITGVDLQLPDDFDLEHDNVQAFWKHLSYKLQAAKARNPDVRMSVTHPLLHFGHTDGTYYATRTDEGNELISTVSARKRERNYELRRQHDLPEDFDAIANASSPQNYFALLYADGDGLGQALQTCATLPDIRVVATSIDAIVSQVKQEAIEQQNLASHYYDTLLYGGDDLILAVPAHTALAIALHISEAFQRQTRERFGTPYTLSTAIVWAHATFPFGAWLETAESALKFAKQEGAKRQQQGLINFLVISSANHLDYKQFHQQLLTSKIDPQRQIVRTLRPYAPQVLQRLIDYRHTLRRMPRSKLAALRHAVFQPRNRAIFEALRVLVHWRDDNARQSVQDMVHTMVDECTGQSGPLLFPFVEVKDQSETLGESATTYCTPLADLAELWDFISGGSDED
jgi:hypothetical protein